MVRTRRHRASLAARAGTAPPSAGGGWSGLHEDLLAHILRFIMSGAAQQGGGVPALKAWAGVLSTCAAWRQLAKQIPIDVVCPPSPAVLAWLRHVRVRRLEFMHSVAATSGDLGCQGFASSEQRYRAAISTLLATIDFINSSGATLQELAGVHPREGILYLTPFQALERISMSGTASETCKLSILEGLLALREVVATGYGEYATEKLPSSVQRLDLQWATTAISFSTINFHLPDACALAELVLHTQRPVCLGAPCLSCCTALRLTARRAYLGLPLLRGAPWVDVDELAARFAQFMLGSALEAVEVTATRCFIYQPVQDIFDLATNDGLGGVAQQEQLATVLLARHFQSLHVEQRMLAVGAFRAFVRITRRRAEPMAFSFQAPLNGEQLDFLQRHALATSISFGPAALSDTVAVLNCDGFAARNGGLLQQLQHLELSSRLDLSPYSALHSIHGTWHSEPLAPLGPAQLTSLRLTPPLGAQQAQRAFRTRWLSGARGLSNLTLVRFASADLSHLRVSPIAIHISSMQPPGGAISPETLQLPPGGLGPGSTLSLRMAYAPPHAIQGPLAVGPNGGLVAAQHMPAGQMVGVVHGWVADFGVPEPNNNNNGGGGGAQLGPGALAVALQQQAAALAAMAQEAAAVAAPAAAAAAALQQPDAAAPQDQQAVQEAVAQVVQQAAEAEAVAVMAEAMAAEAQVAIVQQHQLEGEQAPQQEQAALAPAAVIDLIDLISDEEEEGGGAGGGDAAAQAPQEQPAAEQQQPALGAAAGAPAAAEQPQQPQPQADDMVAMVEVSSDDEDEVVPIPVAGSDDDEDAFVPPPQAGMLGNGPMGLGPWVMVPPPPPQEVAAAAAQQVPNGADFAQPWGMPDDRLCDVTIRHDALFSAAGHVTVHAGTLTVAFTGCEPEHLLQLLTGSVGGCATAAAGAGALRTLRLSARSLRFDALPAKAGSDGGQQAGTATPQQSQQQARRGYSGAEVRDFILATEWSALWEAKLQRSMFRDQETLLLTRRPPPAEPADAAASPPPVAGMAAPAPGTH